MTQGALRFDPTGVARSISPLRDLGAYEALWLQPGMTFKRIADRFREQPDALPSDLVDHDEADRQGRRVIELLKSRGIDRFGVRVHRAGDYPPRLRDAAHPIELLYFRGFWDFVDSPCVAVVGTRKPTEEGVKRTRQLVREFVKDDWTIVSGLATGIDTAAHRTALELGGRTIAVIGTSLGSAYPAENKELQERIAREMLLVSQVPVLYYESIDWRMKRTLFPERNVTMSALTRATIIVEAGETSGTLIQARAALKQGRKLFILESCFRKPELTWPARFEKQGAVRVANYEQIKEALAVHEN